MRILVRLMFVLMLAVPCWGKVIFVDSANEGGTENGQTWETAWGTINEAIADAGVEDSIINVRGGPYTDHSGANFVQLNADAISLIFVAHGAVSWVPAGTVNYGFRITGNGGTITFNGFTLSTSTDQTDPNGCTIFRDTGSKNLVLTNCTVTGSASAAYAIYWSGGASTRSDTYTNCTITTAARGLGFNGGGSLTVTGGSITSTGILGNDWPIQLRQAVASIAAVTIRNVTLTGGTECIHFAGNDALSFGNVLIEGCTFNLNAGSGSSAAVLFLDDAGEKPLYGRVTITGCTMIEDDGIAIKCPGNVRNLSITNNTFALTADKHADADTLINLGTDTGAVNLMHGTVVSGNRLSYAATGADTGVCVLFLGRELQGAKVFNNTISTPVGYGIVDKGHYNSIHHNSVSGSNCIWLSTGCSYSEVMNNSCYCTNGAALTWITVGTDAPTSAVISQNIFHSATGASYCIRDASGSHGSFRVDRNVYYDTGATHFALLNGVTIDTRTLEALQTVWDWYSGADSSNDDHSAYANPRFVNAAGGDLRIQATSPAKGTMNPSDPDLSVWNDKGAFQRQVVLPLVINP